MDNDTRRKIDARAGDEMGLWIHMHGPDPEAAAWAAERLIEHYANLGKHGALLKLREMGRLPVELREKAELAIVDSIPVESKPVPGRQPPKHGILDDLTFDRGRPETVRVAAGMKKVDRAIARLKGGDETAKKEIEMIKRHRRVHWYVKTYADNSLGALEAAKEKQAKGAFKGKRMNAPPNANPQQGAPKGRFFALQ